MSHEAKLNNYRITKIDMDLENLGKGKNKIQLSTSINIAIPKDENDPECIVEIKSSFRSERSKNILSVSIQGYSEIVADSPISYLSDDEKQALIESQIVPELYEELRSFIGNLLENSHVEFMNISPYAKIN